MPALTCLALAAALPRHVGADLTAALRAAWSGGDAHGLWDMFHTTWPMIVVLLLGLTLAAAAITGSLGQVEGGRERLGRVGAVRPEVAAVLVGAGVLVVLGLAVRGVIAGAARGALAGEAGLATLWVEWLRRALLAAGLVSLVAAALEVVAKRAALRRALFQTRAEAEERSG